MAEPAAPARWEVGSEFHWSDDVLRPHRADRDLPWSDGGVGFASGAGALRRLLEHAGCPTVHLPSYFCVEVAEVLVGHVRVAWYHDRPDGHGPRFDTLRPRAGDAVLAVDLFGRSDPAPWRRWSRRHPDVVLVEDHTHDPLSAWARTSTAPYCLASLRKSLPVPDGAVVWSPGGRPCPAPEPGDAVAAGWKLEAMRAKTRWLGGADVDKPAFRALARAGEEAITGCAGPLSAFTARVLPHLDAAGLRARRAANVARAERALRGTRPAATGWAPLALRAPGAVPFGVQVRCRDRPVRDALLAHLHRHAVFAAVHWPQSPDGLWSGDVAALALGERLLTLPLDHRYGPDDVDRVVEVLRRFRSGAADVPAPRSAPDAAPAALRGAR